MRNQIVKWTSVILLCILIYIFLIPHPQGTTQKQHNFQVGDDTEHIWIGGNGDTIIE